MKSHESKMLAKVRHCRQKACGLDKAKSLPTRAEETEELARKLDLPLAQPHRTSK
jgi:hypothetical protein